jgi:hypothetical protein
LVECRRARSAKTGNSIARAAARRVQLRAPMPTNEWVVDLEGGLETEAAFDWVRGAASGAMTGGAVAGPVGAAVGALAGGAMAAARDGAFAPLGPIARPAPPAQAGERDHALRQLAELLPRVQRLVHEATAGYGVARYGMTEEADDDEGPGWAFAGADDPEFEDD